MTHRAEYMERLIKTHRHLSDSHALCGWWRFFKRRKLQRSINAYTTIILTHLNIRTNALERDA